MIIDTPNWDSANAANDYFGTTTSTVYEPAEDTFLMLDALQLDLERVVRNRLLCESKFSTSSTVNNGALLVVELGSGAGLLSAAVAKALRGSDASAAVGAHCMAVDVNPAACHVTAQTCKLNGVQVDVVCGDLLIWMRRFESSSTNLQNVYGPVDVLLFNPPYVRGPDGESVPSPTEPQFDSKDKAMQEQLLTTMINSAWLGGGPDGVDVLKRALHQAADLLSERGVFYALMIDYNYKALVRDEMCARYNQSADGNRDYLEDSADYVLLTTFGSRPLACRRVISRHVPGERLAVYRIYRPHVSDLT